MQNVIVDDLDVQLLGQLQSNARVSFVKLAERLKVSRTLVTERVRALEDLGVITGYRAVVDPSAIGLAIRAVVRISAVGHVLSEVAKAVAATPEVLECHRGTGSDCFIMSVVAESLPDLERVVDRFTGFGTVTTSIVLSTLVERRAIPLKMQPRPRTLRQPGAGRRQRILGPTPG